MLAHRLRELWPFEPATYTPAVCVPVPSAFVVWPLVPYATPGQFAQMEYLYRVAYEQAQAQTATPSTSRISAFSIN